jgi:hypothetical protein
MRHSATHTQQHSGTETQNTVAHGNQRATYTQTSKHAPPQRRTPLHYTPNMVISTVVTHNGSAALHTRPPPQAAASRAATPHTQHFHHGVAVAVASYTTAVRHCDCDTHDHRTRVALVRSTDCQRPQQPPTTHARCNTALPLQRGGNAHVHAAQRDAQTRAINGENNPTQRCAVTQQPQRQETTHPQPQYCDTSALSLHSRQLRQRTPNTRILHRAYDAAMTPHIFAVVTHMTTSAALPDTITPHNHARTDTHTTRQAPSTTTPRQRHGACHPKQPTANKPRTPHPTLARSIQTHKPRTPARRPAQPQPLRTAQSLPHAHRHAHATHSTAHSSDNPTRRPQKITPSHTRGLRATLTPDMSGCPAMKGCCPRAGCRPSPTPCRAHEQPSRHTMAPDADADPSQPPATHLSASHNTVCE